MTMIREAGSVLSRELDERIKTFTEQLEERKNELQKILHPPKPDLVEQMRYLLMEMSALVRKVELRTEMISTWEAEPPEAVLRAYEDSLASGETRKVEMFEAYAEGILERKGDVASLAAFREKRDSRVAPVHLKARQELQELARLGTSLRAIISLVASTLKGL